MVEGCLKSLLFTLLAASMGFSFVGMWDSPLAQAQNGGYINPQEPLSVRPRPVDPKIDYQRRGSRVVFRSAEPRDDAWTYNAEMSRSCRRGNFKQRADRRFVALFGEDVYGAAIGGHASLIDNVRLGEASVLYIFRGQGSTRCRVYHRGED